MPSKTSKPSDKSEDTSSLKKKSTKDRSMPKLDFKDPRFWNWFFREWILTVAVAFAVAFFFRSMIASPRHIPTGSMIPTIKIGEFIFVNMFKYDWHIPYTRQVMANRADPKHGEIVVFEYPEDPDKDFIKRVVGLPGDTIELRDKRVIVNGTPLKLEPVEDRAILEDLKYDSSRISLFRETNGDNTYFVMHLNDGMQGNFGPINVPEGYYFVMGDNRDDSYDSRMWGPLQREKVFGTGSFTWLSVDTANPPWIRWSRLFKVLH